MTIYAETHTPLVTAMGMFSPDNVISVAQGREFWGQDDYPVEPLLIPYTLKQLERCQQQNEDKTARWYLHPLFRLTISQTEEYLNNTTAYKDRLVGVDNWRNSQGDAWVHQYPPAEFCLTDLTCRFESRSWEDQGLQIKSLGPDYARAHDWDVLQLLLTLWGVHGKAALLTITHWGVIECYNREKLVIKPKEPNRIELASAPVTVPTYEKLTTLVSLMPTTSVHYP